MLGGSLLNRPNQFPTAKLGKPIGGHLIHNTGKGGLPKVHHHFLYLLFFSFCDFIIPKEVSKKTDSSLLLALVKTDK